MLLGLCLAQSVPPPAVCLAPAAEQNLTQPQYQSTTKDIGARFMAALVQSFLHTVQPKPFPQGQCLIHTVLSCLNALFLHLWFCPGSRAAHSLTY